MSARGRARETISDKRVVDGGVRKKTQTKNVRDLLVYRKNLATMIEESVRNTSILLCEIHASLILHN